MDANNIGRSGCTGGDWRRATLRKAKPVPARSGTFLADPFVVVEQGVPFLFAEEFDYGRGLGDIVAFRYLEAEDRFERLGVVLSDDTHYSFPFIFRDGDELFMAPENAQSGKVRLLRCVDFPLSWVEEAILIDDIRAVDPIVFELDGGWWMLVSERIAGSSGSMLWLYAADAVRGPWKRCGDQPVSNRAQASRNGGLLRGDDDTLYRVAQCFDFGGYGSAVDIYRIVKVSHGGYREEHVQHVRPDFDSARGGHHFHNEGEYLAFDWWVSRRPG